MSSDINDAVWRDIDKSGVELELRVASTLHKAGWGALAHQYYMDYDEEKARELDIVGGMGLDLNMPNYLFDFNVHLLTQCKKIPGNSWTFFVPHDEKSSSPFSEDLLTIGDFHSKTGVEQYGINPFNMALHRAKKTEFSSVLYREAVLDQKKSNKQTNNLFEASISTAKAWEFDRKEALKKQRQQLNEYMSELLYLKTEDKVKADLASSMLFDGMTAFQPLIVFEGNMFAATLESRQLRPANLVCLLIDYHSSRYEVEHLAVDVCNMNYLPEYLSMFNKAISEFKETVMKPQRPPYGRPGTDHEYDYSKSWLENMRLRLINRLAKEVSTEQAKDTQANIQGGF